MLFMVKFHVKQPDKMTQAELYDLWIKEGEAALIGKKGGVIKELYKVSGLKQVVAILDVPSHHDLDMTLASLPFNKESGLLDVEITPIHPYEEYYHDMKKAVMQIHVYSSDILGKGAIA